MALLSLDRNCGESTAVDSSRLNPTPFLTKTYQLVDDRDVDDVISWNADGSTFIVWDTAEFARDLLPKYFKHNNFSSFIRQLNTYGFRKVVPDRWEFSNECFRRGDKKLLCDIHRRKIAPPATAMAVAQPIPPPPPVTASPSDSGEEQVLSSSFSPSSIFNSGDATSDLIGENKRLKKENVQLSKELSHMKSLCNNIYVLMSGYNNDNHHNNDNRINGHDCELYSTETVAKPLDLLPMTRFYEETAAADGGDGNGNFRSTSEDGMDLRLQLPGEEIKSEPLDRDERGVIENLRKRCSGDYCR